MGEDQENGKLNRIIATVKNGMLYAPLNGLPG